MKVDFGNLEVGSRIPVHRWLSNIKRYASVRFFGFVRGRFFVGIICGSKGKDALDLCHEEICRLSKELDEARRLIGDLLKDEKQAV